MSSLVHCPLQAVGVRAPLNIKHLYDTPFESLLLQLIFFAFFVVGNYLCAGFFFDSTANFDFILETEDVESCFEFEVNCAVAQEASKHFATYPNTRTQKRLARGAPDATALCAFAQHAVGLWRSQVPRELVAKMVASLTMCMASSGVNTQLPESMKAELQLDIAPRDVMHLVVAWEDANGVEYDLGTKKFRVVRSKQTSTLGVGAKHASKEWRDMKHK